jgi:hypothetical protein
VIRNPAASIAPVVFLAQWHPPPISGQIRLPSASA